MKEVWAKFKTSGAQVVHGQIEYSLNVGQKSEESYILPAKVEENQVTGIVPEKATYYLFNFIEENNFLISYLDMPYLLSGGQKKGKFLILRKLLV